MTAPTMHAGSLQRPVEGGPTGGSRPPLPRRYEVMAKAGRLANGAERDGGRTTHALPLGTEPYSMGAALCGTAPGRSSGGWVFPYHRDAAVDCPRCLRLLPSPAPRPWCDRCGERWPCPDEDIWGHKPEEPIGDGWLVQDALTSFDFIAPIEASPPRTGAGAVMGDAPAPQDWRFDQEANDAANVAVRLDYEAAVDYEALYGPEDLNELDLCAEREYRDHIALGAGQL